MSDKPRFHRAAALPVVRELLKHLEPVTDRLIVAGSLRRKKLEVGDIEFVFIPKREERQLDLVTVGKVDLAAEVIERLVTGGVLAKRENVNGGTAWGDKNKLAVHVTSGIPVDLFFATEDNWWNYLVCRTGPKECNARIATAAQAKGWKWQPYKKGFTDGQGRLVRATSERHVFELAGLPYQDPCERA
jgi:DNA polymerase/3'-5' exonuclease PolX